MYCCLLVTCRYQDRVREGSAALFWKLQFAQWKLKDLLFDPVPGSAGFGRDCAWRLCVKVLSNFECVLFFFLLCLSVDLADALSL